MIAAQIMVINIFMVGGSSIGAIRSTNETGIRAQDQGTAGDIEQIEIVAYIKGGYLRTRYSTESVESIRNNCQLFERRRMGMEEYSR